MAAHADSSSSSSGWPASVGLGRIAGIPIGLHVSWILIALVITVTLAGHFGVTRPDWSGATIWITAVVTGALFFVTLLAHELAHALVARSRGVPVQSITLFALGGVAQFGADSASAATEFLVSIAGPVTSLVIGIAGIGIAQSMGWSYGGDGGSAVAAALGWLGSINVMLAAFNMLPGLPLDGGRVVRAAVWRFTGDPHLATRIAARAGQGVAILLIALGLFQFVIGAGFGGLWLVLIGWFLLFAARAAGAEAQVAASLGDLRVADVMATCTHIAADMPLHAWMAGAAVQAPCAVVEDNGAAVGVVTPGDARRSSGTVEAGVSVSDVMRPLDRGPQVAPDTGAGEALAAMAAGNLGYLPVVSHGSVAGIVSRAAILDVLRRQPAR